MNFHETFTKCKNNRLYTVNHKKRWQNICDHNSGKSLCMHFYNFCTVVNRKKHVIYIWQKFPPHLNNTLTLPSENKNITFHTFIMHSLNRAYYTLHQAEWQTRWHNPPDWGLVSSVATCLALWSVIQQRVYETRVHNIDELRQRLLHVRCGLKQSLIDDAVNQ